MASRRLFEIGLYAAGPAAIFITAPILARGLGPEGRGELGVAQSVASFALALGAVGQAEVYLADRKNGSGNIQVAGRIALLGATFTSILAAIWLLVLGVSPFVVMATVILIPVLSQSQLWRSSAISGRRLSLPAFNNAAGALLRVVLLLALVFIAALSTASAMLAIQLSAALAALLTVGVYAFRQPKDAIEEAGLACYGDSFRRGLPLIAFSLLTSVTLRSDIIALQVLDDAEAVGIYAAAASLSMAVLSISGAFKTRAQGAVFDASPRRSVRRELIIVSCIGSVGALGAILLSPWIVEVLLGPGFESAVPILQVLAVSCVALLVLDTVHGVLAVLGKRKVMVLVGGAGAATRLATLLVFVPSLGPMGAAISTVVSYTVAGVVGWIAINRGLAKAI